MNSEFLKATLAIYKVHRSGGGPAVTNAKVSTDALL